MHLQLRYVQEGARILQRLHRTVDVANLLPQIETLKFWCHVSRHSPYSFNPFTIPYLSNLGPHRRSLEKNASIIPFLRLATFTL